jgi:hypothetical protein
MATPATSTRAPVLAERRGLAPMSAAVARVTAPLLRKRGLVEARIVTEWPAIVGARAAARSAPLRFIRSRQSADGGTLRLRVAASAALEFQHVAPELMSRINGYFGYTVVTRLQLIQAPVPAPARRAPLQPVTPEAEARLAARAATLEDPDLRNQIIALGRALEARAGARQRRPKEPRKSV